MQIIRCSVIPLKLKLRRALRLANLPPISQIDAFFVHLETRDRRNAWGCSVAHPDLTGEQPEDILRALHAAADRAPDLNPLNIEHSLAVIQGLIGSVRAAHCAFDLAFYDLLGLAAGMPLYRLLGGYRNQIQTSATIPISTAKETVEMAQKCAADGFGMLKIKGGADPEADVQRIHAVRRALPHHILRLDADGGYTTQQALDVARALHDVLEMLEQPTPPDDLESLRQVTTNSPLPILADQSLRGPASALELTSGRYVDGLSMKITTCGGLQCARQVEAIARAAHCMAMVSCVIEPALLTAAGLSLALSSPVVQYADLDGFLELDDDPSNPSFVLKSGMLIASEVPGLGCTPAI